MRYYSKETGSTYLQGLHSHMPADAVKIDEARYQSVIANPEEGKVRSHDDEGLPILVDPPAHVPSVPVSVSMRQARLAMLGAGILYDVEAIISGMEGDEGKAAQIDWEFAQDVRRDWPLVVGLGAQLGMTEEQIDELFVAAAAIPQ